MYRKKQYRRLSRKEIIINDIKTYLIILILMIMLFLILNTLNNIRMMKKVRPRKPVVILNIKRSEAYVRGMNIINYVWEYDSSRNGIINSDQIELPDYLKNENKIKVSGLPYCWGGYLSLDKSNISNINNFQDAINKGYVAGNINCAGNYKKYTAGLDCSGFVCAVFNIMEKTDTAGLNSYFNKIKVRNLKPMDIFNCEKKHVFIYIKETMDKKGIITMEATTNRLSKISERTAINYRSWDSIKKGMDGKPFIPMRYKGIIDDKVNDFKDIYEYNNNEAHAINMDLNQYYKGSIDFANDMDYFRVRINRTNEYKLNVLNLPQFCRIYILDDNGEKVFSTKKKGIYSLKLMNREYFIKIEGIDFKFDTNNSYLFSIEN